MKSRYFKVTLSEEKGKASHIEWAEVGDEKSLKEEVRELAKLGIARDVWAKATPFQRKVWRACLAIPAGSVATYSDIAHAIGKPRAVRAVANALGKNPVTARIPCHRVIGMGTLGGYSCRFGLKAKLALLRAESV